MEALAATVAVLLTAALRGDIGVNQECSLFYTEIDFKFPEWNNLLLTQP